MGLSLFFRNKWIFWLWIFTPLLIREVCVIGLAAMERKSKQDVAYEQALAELAPTLESTLEKSKETLKEFKPFEDMSSQERFLTDFSKVLFDLGLQGETEIGQIKSDKGLGINTYNFKVTGQVPDLPAFSRLLDQASLVEYLRIFSCDIERKNRGEKTSYSFSIAFSRTEIQSRGAK